MDGVSPNLVAQNLQRMSWFSIARLGLVQTALGAIVVLTTSTMNRVMVVELALPAIVPGFLVALHYALQILRPRWGYGSDVSANRTPWIIAGMAILATGAVAAATGIYVVDHVSITLGIFLSVLAFCLIGIGVGATGTSLLALLASRVGEERRAPAATIVWLMMIAGFAVTSIAVGSYLDPFTSGRLLTVTAVVSALAFLVAVAAIWGVKARENAKWPVAAAKSPAAKPPFKTALLDVWSDAKARRFTIFIFVSMLAYSMQDLILEPYAGLVFGLTPGASTKLSGVQHGGVFAGMLFVALAANPKFGFGSLRVWTACGCVASALALLSLVMSAVIGPAWPLRASVFLLGVTNGAYAVAAIGSMMGLAASGRNSREGVRMGIWGAAQAVAFGIGGFFGTAAVDVMRKVVAAPATAYASVFIFEALLFLAAAALALRSIDLRATHKSASAPNPVTTGGWAMEA
jgi:MFS transporter, BCD family, chlorophyll transporter